jgi:hypothetical protein
MSCAIEAEELHRS